MKHKLIVTVMTGALLLLMSSQSVASTNEYEANPVEAPVNVSAKATKKATIVVKWKKVEGVSSYEVYRSTKRNGKYKLVKRTNGNKYVDKNIHPKKRYYYKINSKGSERQLKSESGSSEIVNAKLKVKKSFKVKAYAYSGGGTTKMGKKAKVGRIAVDPKVIKLGTWLYVEGYGICQACDTGGNIKGKTIDVYKKSNKQARKWGVRKPKIYIIG